MKRFLLCVLALLAATALLAACGGSESAPSAPAGISAPAAVPTPEPTPTPTPTPPPYEPNILTGAARGADYGLDQRPLAVMINNITQARPQYGISKADIITEIEVEGGITRLMAIFQNYKTIGEVGPIRSARIQYLELIVPWEMIYIHDGENEATVSPLVNTLDYNQWNIKNPENYGVSYRVNRTNWAGSSLDSVHREFFSGEKLDAYLTSSGVDTQRHYNTGTFFTFVDYRDENPVRDLSTSMDSAYTTSYGPVVSNGTYAEITHNENQDFRTRFFYNSATNTYDMEQWYDSNYYGGNQWMRTMDAANNTQLTFTNLVILFTEIDNYPGTAEKGGLKRVDYKSGGVGYYFYGGKSERIFWEKGNPYDMLRLYYLSADGGNSGIPLEVNIGKTYLSVVDLDCYEMFANKSLTAEAGQNETPASRSNVGSGTTLRGAAPPEESAPAGGDDEDVIAPNSGAPEGAGAPAVEDPVVDPVLPEEDDGPALG